MQNCMMAIQGVPITNYYSFTVGGFISVAVNDVIGVYSNQYTAACSIQSESGWSGTYMPYVTQGFSASINNAINILTTGWYEVYSATVSLFRTASTTTLFLIGNGNPSLGRYYVQEQGYYLLNAFFRLDAVDQMSTSNYIRLQFAINSYAGQIYSF